MSADEGKDDVVAEVNVPENLEADSDGNAAGADPVSDAPPAERTVALTVPAGQRLLVVATDGAAVHILQGSEVSWLEVELIGQRLAATAQQMQQQAQQAPQAPQPS